jgi:hypothetical protein
MATGTRWWQDCNPYLNQGLLPGEECGQLGPAPHGRSLPAGGGAGGKGKGLASSLVHHQPRVGPSPDSGH